jgi:hypothetical protein
LLLGKGEEGSDITGATRMVEAAPASSVAMVDATEPDDLLTLATATQQGRHRELEENSVAALLQGGAAPRRWCGCLARHWHNGEQASTGGARQRGRRWCGLAKVVARPAGEAVRELVAQLGHRRWKEEGRGELRRPVRRAARWRVASAGGIRVGKTRNGDDAFEHG